MRCVLHKKLDFVNTTLILDSQKITVIRHKGKKNSNRSTEAHGIGNQLRLLLA